MLCVVLVAAPAAQAAKTCSEPGRAGSARPPPRPGWSRGAAGRDRLRQLDLGFAIRVYRHGCLVGEDRLAALNRDQRYESWSMAKSVTSMMFGRAMTLGLISPDDPVGSLVPEADEPHGEISMRDLLTMTSGLGGTGSATTTSSRCPTG